jgi:NAD(P)-dependent dehydrogenase (short-subunit alcohol dehydrogenase family)
MLEFSGQVALVTGAGQGLGRAIATSLARRGATVYMADLQAGVVERAAAELNAEGLQSVPTHTDVTDEAQLHRLRDQIAAGPGRLDVLVNNAGGWRYEPIREVTPANWDWTFRVNVLSMFLTSRAFMDMMIAQRYGRIVNISSTDAYRPKPTLPAYAAAKAAIVSLTRTFAEELAPHGVMVNAVSPGAMATETAKSQSWLPNAVAKIPLGRAAEPEDMAEVVAFLASNRNRFVVGESVIANGGALMA